jgi:hypothetical protein
VILNRIVCSTFQFLGDLGPFIAKGTMRLGSVIIIRRERQGTGMGEGKKDGTMMIFLSSSKVQGFLLISGFK